MKHGKYTGFYRTIYFILTNTVASHKNTSIQFWLCKFIHFNFHTVRGISFQTLHPEVFINL